MRKEKKMYHLKIYLNNRLIGYDKYPSAEEAMEALNKYVPKKYALEIILQYIGETSWWKRVN